jgi:hypothetical protein
MSQQYHMPIILSDCKLLDEFKEDEIVPVLNQLSITPCRRMVSV